MSRLQDNMGSTSNWFGVERFTTRCSTENTIDCWFDRFYFWVVRELKLARIGRGFRHNVYKIEIRSIFMVLFLNRDTISAIIYFSTKGFPCSPMLNAGYVRYPYPTFRQPSRLIDLHLTGERRYILNKGELNSRIKFTLTIFSCTRDFMSPDHCS